MKKKREEIKYTWDEVHDFAGLLRDDFDIVIFDPTKLPISDIGIWDETRRQKAEAQLKAIFGLEVEIDKGAYLLDLLDEVSGKCPNWHSRAVAFYQAQAEQKKAKKKAASKSRRKAAATPMKKPSPRREKGGGETRVRKKGPSK